MLFEVHRGTYYSPQYKSFVTDVQPLLHSHLWQQQQNERFWQDYKIARQASQIVSILNVII